MNLVDKDLLSIQEVRNKVKQATEAQRVYRQYSQQQMDQIVNQVHLAADNAAVKLAKAAKEETGFGRWEDKVVKNTFAAKNVYNAIKNMKTVGVLSESPSSGVVEIGVPVGVIAGLIPSTNPTSTVIFKTLIALKSGNAIVFSPHPSALNCIRETVEILHSAMVAAGAPKGLISCLTTATVDGTSELLRHKDVNLILATGGEAMVRAAYSSGTPAIGVGPGNGPAFIEKTADVADAVNKIIRSKTFDNGVICASEQSIIVEAAIQSQVEAELQKQGGYFLTQEQSSILGKFLLRSNMTINPAAVGKSASELADLVGISIPHGTKVLLSRQDSVSHSNPYSREKLTPVLAFYVAQDWETACLRCLELLANEGRGHTLVIHSKNEKIIREFGLKKDVSRILVNTPAALGGIGATTNLFPSLTLGCGTVGGSSTSDNVGPMNLINIRRIAYDVQDQADTHTAALGNSCTGEIENLVNQILSQL